MYTQHTVAGHQATPAATWSRIFCIRSCLVSQNIQIKIYGTAGCETWSVVLSEEHRLRVLESRVLRVLESRVLRVLESRVLRVLESRVLRQTFGSKRGEVRRGGRKLNVEGRQLVWGYQIKENKMGRACSVHAREGNSTDIALENFKVKYTVDDLGVRGTE